MEQHVGRLNYAFLVGRAIEAPQLHNICISIDEYELMGQWNQWEWLNVINMLETSTQRRKSNIFKLCPRCRCQQQRTENAFVGDSPQRRENENDCQKDLGQSVLQGYKRQVQGSNGPNAAQLGRPWCSTQTLPPRHNQIQRPRQGGHAVIKTWDVANISRVDSRESRIRLSSENGRKQNAKAINWSSNRRRSWEDTGCIATPLLLQLGQHQRMTSRTEYRAVSSHQSRRKEIAQLGRSDQEVLPQLLEWDRQPAILQPKNGVNKSCDRSSVAERISECRKKFSLAKRQPEELYRICRLGAW